MITYPTIRPLRLDDYRGTAEEEQLDRVQHLASGLRGMRVNHVNSTAHGGGVAEILRSLVPLMRDVGLEARWLVIPGSDDFFRTTKRLHNLLQGAEGELSPGEVARYAGHVQHVAKELRRRGESADAWVMHDPQSLPLPALLPQERAPIWICHIDTTAPNQSAVEAVLPWMEAYPLLVFSLQEYTLPQLDPCRIRVVPPAIDPLQTKNICPGPATARRTSGRTPGEQ
ncbi:MAG: hypothetical protein ACE5IA_08065 [Dehalococcoidia bacterium]